MALFLNHYVHCGKTWNDTWSCMSNDECPECGTKDIEPWASESLDRKGESIGVEMHVGKDFVPATGWPEGIGSLQQLIQYELSTQ